MSIAQLIRDMSAAGAPAEAIALAVEAIEAAQSALEDRRAVERDRKRRQRERAKDTGGTVTGRSRDTDGTFADTPSLSPSPLPSPHTPQPTPRPHTHPDNTPARKADPFPCPDWCEMAVWRDLKANRKAKRLANTATAHERFIAAVMGMADDEWPPGRIVQAIAANGWGGAHDPRPARSQKHENRDTDRRDGAAKALDRMLGIGEPAFPPGRRNDGAIGGNSQRALPAR